MTKSAHKGTFGCKKSADCGASSPSTSFDISHVDGYTAPYKLHILGNVTSCDMYTKTWGLNLIDGSKLDLSKCPSG